MTPDEYDLAIKELEQEEIEAERTFEAETKDEYQKLIEARTNYYAVTDPALARYETKISEIEDKKQKAYGDMWEAHLERERQHNAFVLDLLKDPDKIEEKLQAKIKEESVN